MKKYVLSLVLLSTVFNFAYARMHVSEAMESLNGEYELVSSNSSCAGTLQVDLSLIGDHLTVNRLEFENRNIPYIVTSEESRLTYGTKSRGKIAFIKYKLSQRVLSDGYSGAVFGRTRSSLELSKEEGSDVLRVQHKSRGWSLFNYSCTDPRKFFRNHRVNEVCEYRKR